MSMVVYNCISRDPTSLKTLHKTQYQITAPKMYMIFLLLILSVTPGLGKKDVKFAAVIYRHGDRTPVNPYPNDPWKDESLWPVQFGELTNIGKQQHYALGQWLRKRYSTLISEKFNYKEIYVRSTDVDRTLMSAQVSMAGMYPPSGDSIWNKNILWQPIPIHTRPEIDDEVLAMKRYCVTYEDAKEKYIQSIFYKKKLNKYRELMNNVTVYTGKKINNFEDLNDIYNVLYIEELYNFTLPDWTKSIYPDKLREPACYSFKMATATPLMSRLMAGPLLKEIVMRMIMVQKKMKQSPPKLSIYSGHDFTIGNVLNSLRVYDGNCPVYTATIIFELLQDTDSSEYFIRVLYRNSTEIVEPHIISIPHCGEICPINRFIKLYEFLVTVDWEYECTTQIQELTAIRTAFIIILLIGFLFVINKVHSGRPIHDQIDYINALLLHHQHRVRRRPIHA